jgi:hypothetical protein
MPPGSWMSVSCECRVLSGRDQADLSSRGVLPSVVCTMRVIAKPRKGKPYPKIGSKRYRKEKKYLKRLWEVAKTSGIVSFRKLSFETDIYLI